MISKTQCKLFQAVVHHLSVWPGFAETESVWCIWWVQRAELFGSAACGWCDILLIPSGKFFMFEVRGQRSGSATPQRPWSRQVFSDFLKDTPVGRTLADIGGLNSDLRVEGFSPWSLCHPAASNRCLTLLLSFFGNVHIHFGHTFLCMSSRQPQRFTKDLKDVAILFIGSLCRC